MREMDDRRPSSSSGICVQDEDEDFPPISSYYHDDVDDIDDRSSPN